MPPDEMLPMVTSQRNRDDCGFVSVPAGARWRCQTGARPGLSVRTCRERLCSLHRLPWDWMRPPLPFLLGQGKGNVASISEADSCSMTTRPHRVSAGPCGPGLSGRVVRSLPARLSTGLSLGVLQTLGSPTNDCADWAPAPSPQPWRAHHACRGLCCLSALEAELSHALSAQSRGYMLVAWLIASVPAEHRDGSCSSRNTLRV